MRADQDWCLECGAAAPGRLGARPGWRAAFMVVGVTLALVIGAVAASYAALTGQAERDASRPSTGAGAALTAPAPSVGQTATPVTPGATGPGTTAPATIAPPATVIPTPQPVKPAPNTPQSAPPATSTPKPDAGGSPTHKSSGGSSAAGPETIKIAAATTYDPTKRAGAEFGPAANAIDSSATSVWDVTTPADAKPLSVGLVLDLGAAYALDSLTISTPTQGFDVELYGARSKGVPPDILDGRWDHLLSRHAYADLMPISLAGKSKSKLRYVVLWFTKARDVTDPRVAIRDVTVTATK